MDKNHVIFYDATCGFCSRWVRFLLKADKKKIFYFSSLHSAAGHLASSFASGKSPTPDSVIYYRNNSYYTSSDAVIQILSDCGGLWKLVRIFQKIPVAWRDSAYKFVARNRHQLTSKKSECQTIPTNHIKRFID
jgi:predicted DCC family thiol-disulfide oxidoreductase YuxK